MHEVVSDTTDVILELLAQILEPVVDDLEVAAHKPLQVLQLLLVHHGHSPRYTTSPSPTTSPVSVPSAAPDFCLLLLLTHSSHVRP